MTQIPQAVPRIEIARLRNPVSLIFEIGPVARVFVGLIGFIICAWICDFALFITDLIFRFT